MAKSLISTDEVTGVRVLGGKNGTKRIGKVRYCVFHPRDKRCVGFIVKRPDFLWMFHRKDKFVAINGYDLVDGRIVIHNDPDATDKGACRALGVKWNDCVLWVGLPILTQDGKSLGSVGSVLFDRNTGLVDSLIVTQGATANALLGKREIPASLIKGFRMGAGARLSMDGDDSDESVLGAILVDDDAAELEVAGGLAEKAGKATAIVGDKASRAVESVKPKVSQAAKTAGEVVNTGAYLTGRQIKKAKGMFSAFKEEYNKARYGDDE